MFLREGVSVRVRERTCASAERERKVVDGANQIESTRVLWMNGLFFLLSFGDYSYELCG